MALVDGDVPGAQQSPRLFADVPGKTLGVLDVRTIPNERAQPLFLGEFFRKESALDDTVDALFQMFHRESEHERDDDLNHNALLAADGEVRDERFGDDKPADDDGEHDAVDER